MRTIATLDLTIPSDTPGVELHLRNKRVERLAPFTSGRTVVLVHGATYSSASLFDVRLDGLSFLDHLALEGFDAYALDMRGFGGSTRPPEMDAPPDAHPPLGGTEIGVRDLGAAVGHVLRRTGLARLNLFGMSWGGTVAGAYASRHPGKVVRLALLAPQWVGPGPARLDGGGTLGAYRRIPVLQAREPWLAAAPAAKRAELIPPGWFEAWAEASLATDPQSGRTSPPTMRAVNGPVLDVREYWSAGRPFYDPGLIRVPVLLVHAEWDVDAPFGAARGIFQALVNAPYRRWVEIGEGTHRILLEKNRMQAYRAISHFLDEPDP